MNGERTPAHGDDEVGARAQAIVDLFARGGRHLEGGRLDEAAACYERILALAPGEPNALHMGGIVALRRGEPERAADLIAGALRGRGDDPTAHNNLGNALLALGRVEEAVQSYARAADLRPDHAMAHANLGNGCLVLGRLDEAEQALARALDLKPDYGLARVNLARVLFAIGREAEASSHLERALAATPSDANFLGRAGMAWFEQGAHARALECFDRAIRAEPRDLAAHTHRGHALQMLRRLDEAGESYQRALELDPAHLPALKNLGVVWQERGRPDLAAGCFREAVASAPGDATARHMLAAVTGETTGSAPPGYVVELFDGYAQRFDRHLEDIGYRAPDRLRALVTAAAGPEAHGLRILDLGCGTGRCGVVFRDLAAHLAGVDLSPRMIDRSRARGVYDELSTGDVVPALEARRGSLDVVLAADVFIYVGALDAVFEGAASALAAGGLLAFSVEAEAGEGYRLRGTGRYAHSVVYVEALARRFGFTVVEREAHVVRLEAAPVDGHLFVVRRDPAAGDGESAA